MYNLKLFKTKHVVNYHSIPKNINQTTIQLNITNKEITTRSEREGLFGVNQYCLLKVYIMI